MASWNEEITWIQGSHPDLVIVKSARYDWLDKAHYFYFAVELGKRLISDVEPVNVIYNPDRDRCIILTRVHFNVLVMWVSPKIVQSPTNAHARLLPITRFLWLCHTPSIISEDFENKFEKIKTDETAKPWRKFEYWLGWVYLKLSLKKKLSHEEAKLGPNWGKDFGGYDDRVVGDITYLEKYRKGEILFNSRFLENEAKELAVIGNKEDVAKTIKDIKEIGDGESITVDAIKKFINNFINPPLPPPPPLQPKEKENLIEILKKLGLVKNT